VERIEPRLADQQVAERFFSPRESSALRTLPVSLRVEAFFNCWTRKEAYLKARGEGLLAPLDGFDVSLIPGQPAALLSGSYGRWSLYALTPAPGYAAAVAVEGCSCDLRLVSLRVRPKGHGPSPVRQPTDTLSQEGFNLEFQTAII
jgi:4'-phosphopantetheinyl transferase